MKSKSMNYYKFILLVLLIGMFSVVSQAQEDIKEAMKADNTGTNPINFTNDFRIYYNYAELNAKGDGKAQTTTFEFRTPILNEKVQFRVRARNVEREIDLTGNGVDNIDERGFGDMDIRFLTVPYMNMKEKFALAVGLEAIFDTADDPALGGSSTSLGPQIFAVFFKPPGGGALVAPAYQHVFSVGGENVNRTQLDLFYLYTFKKGLINWALVNPQGVIDYQNDNHSSWNIDCEIGKMITKNQSLYIRPGFGIGGNASYDWDIEFGWKLVW
jgi:hypothetical protein